MRVRLENVVSISIFLAFCVSGPTSAQKIMLKPSQDPAAPLIAFNYSDGLMTAEVRAVLQKIFAPYSKDTELPPWQTKYFTPKLAAQIREWRIAIKGAELTNLSSFDWFCQCQDFDAKTAKLGNVSAYQRNRTGPVIATVEFFPAGDGASAPLIVEFERGKKMELRVSDLVFDGGMRLTSELRREIANKGIEPPPGAVEIL